MKKLLLGVIIFAFVGGFIPNSFAKDTKALESPILFPNCAIDKVGIALIPMAPPEIVPFPVSSELGTDATQSCTNIVGPAAASIEASVSRTTADVVKDYQALVKWSDSQEIDGAEGNFGRNVHPAQSAQ